MISKKAALLWGVLVLAPAGTALSQGMPKGMMRLGDGEGGGGAYRSMVVEIPINVMAKETVARFEFNLAGHATLALEGMYMPQQEEVDDKARKETGESMVSQGKGAALFVARYTDPITMSGFFWAMGLGYRDESVKWRDRPENGDQQINMTLADQGHMMNHDTDLRGTTGHLRVGYRFVGTEVPLLIGCYLGARHFQSTITDVHGKAESASESSTTSYADLTDKEKDRLHRVTETRPETAVELGFMF